VLRQTAIKALEPMRQTAADLAPDDPHTPAPDLKSSIAIASKRSSHAGVIELARGPPSSVQMYMGPTKGGYPEAIVQEFGARPHDIKPKHHIFLELRRRPVHHRPQGSPPGQPAEAVHAAGLGTAQGRRPGDRRQRASRTHRQGRPARGQQGRPGGRQARSR
jgi:hypothetical protein